MFDATPNKTLIDRLVQLHKISNSEAMRRVAELRCIELGLKPRDVLNYAATVDQFISIFA